MSQHNPANVRFDEMDLNPSVISALQTVGYETPTPIQSSTIPHLIQGRDLIGQARTGTGKTAAFALPLLSRLDLKNKRPQILVLTPTRELAIQVADSFKTYGKHMKGLNVLPIYGGQSYGVQLNQLKRGVHVVVGTPGRLMDHMRRKTVTFADLFCLVLDEADEMLHMGFIEDVEWILNKIPKDAQTALFSATMPNPIKKIAQKYLQNPEEIMLKSENSELGTILQKYWTVKGTKKSLALIRILEARNFEGVIVFVKTRSATLDVAKSLENKGFKVEALNGDMAQAARERTVNRLKKGHIDILVATDVAARGLDVDRISHVINYDMPPKAEPYIHRIGRTGRAGRTGEAILFIGRNERWMLKNLERATKQKIQEIYLPSNKDINKKRKTDFKDAITKTLESEDLNIFSELIETYSQENDIPLNQVAAALAKLAHGESPFLLTTDKTQHKIQARPAKNDCDHRPTQKLQNTVPKSKARKPAMARTHVKPNLAPIKDGMERYRIEVGHKHGLRARDVVGAISNEAGIEGKYIGHIKINQDFSHVDLPFGMPENTFHLLKSTWVKSQKMSISKCA
ncbi:MAG: DEAD/DEAH box helicase [Desulfobacula sp.]|nr:DEAD/DEAH box helicase [Desulfobacula sp.]